MTPVYVYILESSRGCKIGISENPRQRARSIATQGGDDDLRLLSAMPVLRNIVREIEREAHRCLDAYRRIGEWFQIDGIAAQSTVEASIISVTKRYALTSHDGNLLPPIVAEKTAISTPIVIDCFVSDRIEMLEGAHVQARVLYSAFIDWCLSNGKEPISETAFGRAMGNRIRKEKASRMRYLDIQIREDAAPLR